MATIEKRGPYQFRAIVRKKGHRFSQTFETRPEAQEWATGIEKQIRLKNLPGENLASEMTLGEALRRYRSSITSQKKDKKNEGHRIGKFLTAEQELCAINLSEVTPEDLEDFRDRFFEDDHSPATTNRYLAILSHLYTVARRKWRMRSLEPPLQFVDRLKENRGRDRRLREGELSALLEAVEQLSSSYSRIPMGAIISFARETCMRRAEIALIEWHNVDFKSRTISLDAGDTKNGEPRRVPLSLSAVAILRDQRNRRSGLVFDVENPAEITKAFIEIRRIAGIDDLRFHDLRHEAISRLAESGKFNLLELKQISGHKTVQMLDRYTHLLPDNLAKKMDW